MFWCDIKTNLDLVDDGATGGKRDFSTDFCRLDIFILAFPFDYFSWFVVFYFQLNEFSFKFTFLCPSLHFFLFCYDGFSFNEGRFTRESV